MADGLYRIRAEMRVNGGERTVVMSCIENETPAHLALKLAAYLSFWDRDPVVDPRLNHPALSGQDFHPDLLGVDVAGQADLWVECGNTAMHKLNKVVRRWPGARVVLFKENELKANHLRSELERNLPDASRVEVYCWPGRAFSEWTSLLADKTEIDGEAGGVSFNLVVNERIYATDLLKV